MNDGDVAGLELLAEHYGFVGVKKEDGATSIVMVTVGEGEVYLRADADFQNQADWFEHCGYCPQPI